MRDSRQIREFKKKAYQGEAGILRRKFCRAYRETLKRVRANTEKQFTARLALSEESISCARGCSYCCFQHISAPAAHSIAVVDYLYEHEAVLTQFIDNYRPWLVQAEKLGEAIDTAYNAAMDPGNAISEGLKGKALSRVYSKLKIPCPFLVENVCSIYEVRPLCCSAHRAVTPKEWCDPADTHEVRTYEAVPEGKDLQSLLDLAPLRLTLYHAALPAMVYRMLTVDLGDILNSIDNEFPELTNHNATGI